MKRKKNPLGGRDLLGELTALTQTLAGFWEGQRENVEKSGGKEGMEGEGKEAERGRARIRGEKRKERERDAPKLVG